MSAARGKLSYVWRVLASGMCFALFGLACVVVSVTVFPLIRLTAPDQATTQRRVRQCIHYFYRGFIGMWRALGVISYELHGIERLRAPGQLVVANHPSLIDVVLISSRMPQVDCIVKDALLRNPFLRTPVRWAGYIANSAPEHLIEDCVTRLHAGNSLLVFPEGTRSVPGRPLKMQRGAAHIALAAGVDLLPVTIRCHPSWLTKTDSWFRVPARRPHWYVSAGEPIRLAEILVPGESPSRAARRVTEHLAEYFRARLELPAQQAAAAAAVSPAGAHTAAAS